MAILAGALAAGAAVRADGGAAPAAEVFRQAGPGQGGVGAGNGGAIGQIDAIDQGHLCATIEPGEVDREAGALGDHDGDARRQAIVVGTVAAVVGIEGPPQGDGQAGQRIVAAAGETVGQARLESGQAPGLREAYLDLGAAGVAVDGPGVEGDHRLVQATQARLYDVLIEGLAGPALDQIVRIRANIISGEDPELGAGLIARTVVDPHVELDGNALEVAVHIQVGDIPQPEDDGLVAIGVGHYLDLGRVEQALQAIGQGRGDGLGGAAGLVACHVGARDGATAQAAGQPSAGDEGETHLLLVEEAQSLGQADPQLIVVVLPLGDQGHHLVADDLADSDLLMAGIGGTAPGVIHAADPGDEDAAGDGDQ